MQALMTEKVTLNTQVKPGHYGSATFWIAYPLPVMNYGQQEDRIARAWGTGATCTEALRDAAQR